MPGTVPDPQRLPARLGPQAAGVSLWRILSASPYHPLRRSSDACLSLPDCASNNGTHPLELWQYTYRHFALFRDIVYSTMYPLPPPSPTLRLPRSLIGG